MVLNAFAAAWLLAPASMAADVPPREDGPRAPDFFGDYTKWKKSHQERGFGFQFNHFSDMSRALSGGARRGSAVGGVSELVLDTDFSKVAGWAGLSFHANTFWIYGNGLTRNYTRNMLPSANIEAMPSLRLSELWLEQKSDTGKLSIRIGQMAAENEFLFSQYGRLFTNGWLASTVSNLPGGGPIYPLSTHGVRLKYDDGESWAVLAALFNGNPAGLGTVDRQRLNRHGLNFRLGDPPLAIVEVQHRYGGVTKAPGTVKLGAWRHFGRFQNLQSGKTKTGNFAVYGVVEQQLMTFDQGAVLAGFGRISASPGRFNSIDLFTDAGLSLAGFMPGRADDVLGLAVSHGRISNAARLSADLSGDPPLRAREMAIELTYSAQLAPFWTLQPQVKHIVHGGGVLDDKGRLAKDSTQFGLRTGLSF